MARDVLIGALRNEGADVAAHDMIRRQQDQAEGMERLAAEYLTLATAAQAERWDILLAGAGFTEAELQSVRSSEALGQLTASLRRAEARRLDVDAALPKLVSGRAFDSAGGIAETVAARVDRWAEAAGSKRRSTADYVVGLIPRARGITDPDMARALTERDRAMQARARAVANDALESGQPWAKALGVIPEEPERRARWVHEIFDGGGLSGPLAHHRKRNHRPCSRRRQHRAGSPAAPGRGRRITCAGRERRGSPWTTTL